MKVIRLQNNVPEIYVNESRDYQLLCRMIDEVVNGCKYDIDSIIRLINTKECNSGILPLLQTKVGFFSNKNFTDETLRLILGAFPYIVRNKGSLGAIKQVIYLFLKIRHIRTSITIAEYTGTETGIGIKLPDHTIIIGMEETIEDYTALYELLKYVMPFGYGFYFFFYTAIDEQSYLIDYTKANILFSTAKYRAKVRKDEGDTWSNMYTGGAEKNLDLFGTEPEDRLLGSVGAVNIYSPYDETIKGETITKYDGIAEVKDNDTLNMD